MMLAKNYVAAAAIEKYRLVKNAATAGQVQKGAAATDEVVGASTEIDAALGERVDVVHFGEAYVEAGAAVAAGKFIVSDANGKGIQAAPAAGANVRTAGYALEAAAAAGDVIRCMIQPGSMQG